MRRPIAAFVVVMTIAFPVCSRAADERSIPRADPTRPAALPMLYVSLSALNALDAYTTHHGVSTGVVLEANPFMKGIAGNQPAIWAVKGGVTFASIYLAERLWRQHRRGQAIAVMLVSNGIAAGVAARNAAVLRAAR